jgi:HSP20 family protein
MDKEEVSTKPVEETALAETKPKEEVKAAPRNLPPFFVEAEKMFDRLAELTQETAHKAYDFFLKRGGEFGRELDDWFKAESEVLRPVAVEITETKDIINIKATVPGFKPDEIEISVKDNILILSGKTEVEEKKEEENTVYSEWRSNRFFRQLTLSSEIDVEKVEARLKDGVLQLTLPKIAPREAKQVAVTAG